MREGRARGEFFRGPGEPMHILALPLQPDGRLLGAIAVFHNVAFIAAPVWRHALTSVAQTLLIVGMTLLIVRWSLGKPLRHMAQWLRDLRTGNASASGQPPKEEIFSPLTSEVTSLATSLHVARAAAEEEARLRDAASSQWTAERLRISMQGKLNGSRLFAVSNREPYEHSREGNSITWSVPPSGLVTALEPVLRACDGTWIAQATGDADRETVDDRGRLRVPPDHPQYTLRRVWLSKEEEAGFYFGFANEGLWPLCHIAHTRPVFRSEDWEQYRAVNRKFADVLLDEMSGESEPIVLVQDYHFALAAAHDQGAPAGCARRHLLAHSLAQSGSLRHLPVAARTAGRPAGRGPDRIPHSGALQQLSGNGGPRAGIAHRLGALRGQSPRAPHHRAAVPHQRGVQRQWRIRDIRGQDASAAERAALLPRTGRQGRLSSAWAWIASTTPRAFRSGCAESSGFSTCIPRIAKNSPSCRSARPAARTSSAIRI